MSGTRVNTIKRLLTGLFLAIVITLAAMLLLAALLTEFQITDKAITFLNQFIKIAAVVIGTAVAVPRGGEKGLVTGALIALLYTVIGYVCYLSLGGASFSFTGMMGELLIGLAAGAVCGAVRANMNLRRKSRTKMKTNS